MKKLLLSLVFALMAHFSYAILNGESFTALPTNTAIQKLAMATVGIISIEPNNKHRSCTGVAIGTNLLLTANHCTINIDITDPNYGKPYPNFMAESKLYLYLPVNGNTVNLTDGNKLHPTIAEVHRAWVGSEVPLIAGDDLAIIKFKSNIFTSYLQPNDIFSSHSFPYIPLNRIVTTLANKLWAGKNKLLYAMGWGSHKHFQFIKAQTHTHNIAFATYMDKTSNDKSMLWLTFSYNFNESNPDNPAESGYSQLAFDDTSLNGVLHQPYSSAMAASLTNYLVHTMPVEKGDSGAPLFACDESSIDCILVGITSYGDSETLNHNGSDVATTLANPFYDLIRKPIK